jgi:hypothetical protein
MAKHKYIKSPEELYDMWTAYKTHVKSNPRFKYILSVKTGLMVPEPLECPLTQNGFEAFCYNKFNVSINHYFDNQSGAYDEYCTVCMRIINERKDDQITGGMVGQYNASITQRLNGLTEKTETTTNTSISILNIDPLDDSKDHLITQNSES